MLFRSHALELGRKSMFFGITKGKNMAFFDDGNKRYFIEKPSSCALDESCICYCKSYDEKRMSGGEREIECIEGSASGARQVCESYDLEIVVPSDGDDFYGSGADEGLTLENGFVIARKLPFAEKLGYRSELKIQDLKDGKIGFCASSGSCFSFDYMGKETTSTTTTSTTTLTDSP